jgi:fibronectin type III domain protein
VYGPLYGVSADSSSDVWIVGEAGGEGAALVHWDGSSFTQMNGPLPPDGFGYKLTAVSAISPTDVWAVGDSYDVTASGCGGQSKDQTLVEHWDGSSWTIVPSPNATADDGFTGVAAISSTDIWAVGYACAPGSVTTLAEHWDGSSWSIVTSPSIGDFAAVSAVSTNDVWAVGDDALAHWNGTSWTTVSNPGASVLWGVAARTATDAWTVGSQGAIERWNGTAWHVVSSPTLTGGTLQAVSADSASDAWAVGYTDVSGTVRGILEHWDGSSWATVSIPQQGSPFLLGTFANSPTDLWVVGLNADDGTGLIDHCDADGCGAPSTPAAPGTPTVTPGNGTATVSWSAPTSDGGFPITGYTIRAFDLADPNQNQTFQVGNVTSAPISGLAMDCQTQYYVVVQATNAIGDSAYSVASDTFRPSGFVPNTPTKVVIFVQGMNSSTGDTDRPHAWSPIGPSAPDYCGLVYQKNGFPDLWGITGSFDPTTPGVTPNFTDAVAGPGAVIFGFSYNGAWLTKSPSGPPVFTEEPYIGVTPWLDPPWDAATTLNDEVQSIHDVWPNAHIVIVGHSEGGMVTENYFERYWPDGDHGGVTHMFSLDSPINGVQDIQVLERLICSLGPEFCVSTAATVFPTYIYRWDSKALNDPDNILPKDASLGDPYTPVGTRGDLVYGPGNWPCHDLDSQILYNDFNALDCFSPGGFENDAVVPPDVITPEGDPSITGGSAYPIDLLDTHSFVMENKPIIDLVLGAVNAAATPAGTRRWVRALHATQALGASTTTPQGAVSPTVASVGDSITISGSDFGASTGQIEFITSAGDEIPASVSSWSDTEADATVPDGATTGGVLLETAEGQEVYVGGITILDSPNAVAALDVQVPSDESLDLQPTTVTVTATDGSSNPVADSLVKVSEGFAYQSATTNASGVATFDLVSAGTHQFVRTREQPVSPSRSPGPRLPFGT